MKKSFILGLVTGLTVAGASLTLANSTIQAILNDQIKVTLNGQVQEFKDETTNETQYPITYKNRTYLPLRTVANLVGVDVDYDASSNTAILNTQNDGVKALIDPDKGSWKSDYVQIIESVSPNNIGFAYITNDDIPELVMHVGGGFIQIYSYNSKLNLTYLLGGYALGTTGLMRLEYVEKENIIIDSFEGTLIDETEYMDRPGCKGGSFYRGTVIHLDTGVKEDWDKTIYVYEENGYETEVYEENVSEEVQEYLKISKSFDLKYSASEAKLEVLNRFK